MARFFFHVKNDSTFFKEEEGENYPNLETARAHAAKIDSELAKETGYEGFALSVTDEQGNEVAYMPIDEPPTEAALQGPGLWRKIIRDRVRPLAAFSHLVER